MANANAQSVVRSYFEEFHNDRRREVLADLMDEALLEPTRAATSTLSTAFPDYRITILHQVVGGDAVATVWLGQGTHAGDWDSPIGKVPATGRQVQWTGTTTLRVVDGRIVEVLGTNWDHLGILQQLGAVASVAPRAGA
ncbi:MAG: ester cyclase [Actinomycetota bacterium]|nr:ester cyclase [Actinomycetota bacterium]